MTLPAFRPQLGDPTTHLDPYLCTMESAAMGLDFTTGGVVSVWGGQLVPYCGRSPQDIVGHGTNLVNAKMAWAHYGEVLDIRDDAWANLQDARKDGNAVLLQGDYGSLPSAETCSSTFNENHCMIVLPDTSVDGLSALTGDPLCSGWRWRKLASLRAYAEKLALDVRGDRTRLFYAVCAAPELPDTGTEVIVNTTITVLPYAGGLYTIAAGDEVTGFKLDGPDGTVGTIKEWTPRPSASSGHYDATMTTTATRGDPFLRVTDGYFAGFYIAASAVSTTPNAAPSTDVKHTVTIAVDGVKKGEFTV